jgi:ATP-dependent DNA ligase
VCCSDDGVPSFGYRRHAADVFLYAFDLIELNGDDLRRVLVEPQARAALAMIDLRRHRI